MVIAFYFAISYVLIKYCNTFDLIADAVIMDTLKKLVGWLPKVFSFVNDAYSMNDYKSWIIHCTPKSPHKNSKKQADE